MQENILSKKLNLGLNFSTPSGGVTSPLLKESMVQTHRQNQIIFIDIFIYIIRLSSIRGKHDVLSLLFQRIYLDNWRKCSQNVEKRKFKIQFNSSQLKFNL